MNLLASLLTSTLKKSVAAPADRSLPPEVRIQHLSQVKRVAKPWGYELWLADGSNDAYAFKIIFLKAGTKTSLQYHKQKAEHNCLLEGTIRLHYQDTESGHIVQKTLAAVYIIAVDPPGLHRIEAITDVVLVETSTAHVDDIVRVDDDYARPDGKIVQEHQTTDQAVNKG